MELRDGRIRFLRKSFNFPGHAHELTFSCFHGLPLLDKDRTRQWLVDAIDQARAKQDFDLWAYVIMPNHAHLLIHPRRETYRIADVLKSIKQPVGRRAINYLRTYSPDWIEKLTLHHNDGSVEHRFWQAGGGYDRNIIEPKTLINSIEYIHANPVRKALAETPINWRWSSAEWYAGERDVPTTIDPIPPENVSP